MNNEFGADLVTLIDDDGQQHEFEILLEMEHKGRIYYALYPTFSNPDDMLADDGSYYIFEVTEEDGESYLSEIEDDELLDELGEIFEENYPKNYNIKQKIKLLFNKITCG